MELMPRPLNDHDLTTTARDSAHQIWLAGLGAYSMAETGRDRLFASLVTEGEALERRIRKAAEDRADQVKEKVTDARSKLERVFEKRVEQTLEALAVPTQSDVDKLMQRVEELAASIQALWEAQEAAGKSDQAAA